jgi:hypothetical protein
MVPFVASAWATALPASSDDWLALAPIAEMVSASSALVGLHGDRAQVGGVRSQLAGRFLQNRHSLRDLGPEGVDGRRYPIRPRDGAGKIPPALGDQLVQVIGEPLGFALGRARGRERDADRAPDEDEHGRLDHDHDGVHGDPVEVARSRIDRVR